MHALTANFGFAARRLLKAPGFTLVAVVTLALGIGANAAMFSLFHGVLLRPLPVPDPASLVNFGAPGPKSGSVSCSGIGSCDYVFSYPMFRDLERRQTSFTGIAAHRGFGANIAVDGRAAGGSGLVVSGSYFPVLELKPALGRLLGPQDEPAVGEGRVVVLSYAYWQSTFGGDPAVLGRTLLVNGQPLEIVGVAPEGFNGTSVGQRPQVFVPLTLRWLMEPYFPASAENRQAYWAYLFARLKPGVAREAAETAINVPFSAIVNEVEAPLHTDMSEQTLQRFKDKKIVLEPGARGQSSTPGQAKLPLTLLLGVTGLVLAIACVNIANLLLTRGAARAGEMAVRASLGASRGRMIVLVLAEAGLLGLLGCIASFPVAVATLKLIAGLLPAQAGIGAEFVLSPAAVAFAVGASLLTVLLFGLFPALQAARVAPGVALKDQAGQPSGGRRMNRFRRGLAVVQITFAMVLLVLAGLFTRSLANISRVDLGMQVDAVATFSVAPILSGYTTERSKQLFVRLEEELAAQPGVVSVASAMVPVLAGDNWGSNVSVEGFEAGPDTDTNASFNEVGPGFFRTLQIPLVAGRDFTAADVKDRPRVAVVNESFARKFGLGADAVGKRMEQGGDGELGIEIVGLARDAKYSEVKGETPPQFFVANRQGDGIGVMNFYVRTRLDAKDVLAAIQRVVAAQDANLPVGDLAMMPTVIRDNVFLDRMIGTLSGAFAALATLLAALGLYGVLSYSVAQRTRELGLRQALGATPGQLRGLVLRQVGAMAAIGGLIGLALSAALGRAAEAALFGLSGHDPAALAAATVALGAVILAAGYLPAHRASRVPPMEALRYE